MKHPPRSVVATAVTLAVVLAIGGCSSNGGSGGPGTATGTTVTTSSAEAATILKQAAEAMRKVTGMHVNLTVDGDVPNLRVTKLEGDIANSPQTVATGSATMLVGNKQEDAKFVYVDGHLYSDLGQPGTYTDFGDGASIYNVSVLLDPNQGLANLLANLKEASVTGSEQVNGVATTKITGNSAADDIATLAGSRLTSADVTTVPTTVWIATDGSSHLVQIKILPTPATSVTLTMSDWGKQVTATKPV
ncbi:LppX_LprAFG lipoprotein [Mycobacterium ulcerans]|uniref:Lipoprotein LprA n=1 Tax=Mycobacterium ulcerans (strain Agy99) TaxID=362242 RepID=A0PUQ6_MYCUA|nr:LppX_LprAFG lipoprotein [Mycobacterium ulcerans]ABL06075.1 lipoprotein LprA [Mycobacterium ulcerans Agy99]MEB3903478.1 LppX_LprAFG lipoprotein [Mycobacterium ulcerans]MEB3907618.1 LppX_LprAFG lipoprotein [Mycobacterium ulcerans]MEB3918040.1 LppX_LprAFG lipoprotein [Mycobacterium ulcerans]MEB3922044.1 LppX_LprAFG lipoprotein [Mycobacterium ulcerans]